MTIVTLIFLALLVALFLAMVGCELLGYHLGRRRRAQGWIGFGEGTSAIETSLFALLGLLMFTGFSISGGESRLDARRRLIVEEANAVETAYLRLDLMPVDAQPELRRQFRDYLDARGLAYYAHLLQSDQAKADHDRAVELQHGSGWGRAAAMSTPDTRPAIIALPAINAMLE